MFDLRSRLVDDFREYITSFLTVRYPHIKEFLESELSRGSLWSEPLLSINPTFESGGFVDQIPDLDSRCGTIFRRGKCASDQSGSAMELYRHQVQAIERANQGRSFVLTTGTGSGKSLSYILPIVNSILKEGSGRGIRAIVVYPMNALANSQKGELEKYLSFGSAKGSVTFARYTGQEGSVERDTISANPPDIILTNYVMLELMLTRPYERKLIEAMSKLKFVVLDELHTYRGRQGADVSLLIRRLREATGAKKVQCIGTSATMSTEGTAADKRAAVAGVASKIFGADFESSDVIGETLLPFSENRHIAAQELCESLSAPEPRSLDEFKLHPLTIWLEHTVALEANDEAILQRAAPQPLFGPGSTADKLSNYASIPIKEAEKALQRHLILAERLSGSSPAEKPFVFRLHQFFSPGSGIFATLTSASERRLSLEGQKSDPESKERMLYPLAFCRSCGQHYYIVSNTSTVDQGQRLVPRQLGEYATDDSSVDGFLYIPDEGEAVDLPALIPLDWTEDHGGIQRVRASRQDHVPSRINVLPSGEIGDGIQAWFLKHPFSLCMNPDCGCAYGPKESDITKLSFLGMQGRSTATTILSLSTLAFLREQEAGAKKLLSFTDNRQDASLQSGHLNDLVEVGTLRSGIREAAAKHGEDGIAHDLIALEVERVLALDQSEYALQPSDRSTQIKHRREALRDVLGYRIYRDLRRGWRINAPNLEQVGLLRIHYPTLTEVCAKEELWQGLHEALLGASPEVREKVCHELLERLRKKLAIRVDYLDPEYQEIIKRRSSQFLKAPYALSDEEAQSMDSAAYCWVDRPHDPEERNDIFLSARSAFGIYLRLPSTFGLDRNLTLDDTSAIIKNLVQVLTKVNILSKAVHGNSNQAYQLNAEEFLWITSEPGDEHKRTYNSFFESFYKEGAKNLRGIYAREHTAQVSAEEREEREQQFRAGELPILYCSPTMELGVDISDLNVVNMRNVPPTPANYAQRSGRAGRSGQAALVYTYCTAGSPHDQYYFRRQEQMVAGSVAPPRLDLANEDLIRAHIHAIWLTEARLDLGHSLAERILDVAGGDASLPLQQEIQDKLTNSQLRDAAKAHASKVLNALGDEVLRAPWHTERWLSDVIDQIPLAFDRACDRWRSLYKSALAQAERQDLIIRDASASKGDRERAERLRREAEKQLGLLSDTKSEFQSDFHAFRYLASEGFLPGYSFPRLPLTAYLPARRGNDQYLSRPRFLAISEFGPGAVVYHEGSRYLVERVMMPPSAMQDGGQLTTSLIKLCTECGYIHSGDSAETADTCERCSAKLEAKAVLANLFRLEGVSLRRRDRITCDEEERMRQGYEIRTGIRFDGRPGEQLSQKAEIKGSDGELIASLTYAPTATIWRINIGWNRRKDKSDIGYKLDLDRARWISDKGANDLFKADPVQAAHRVAKVVPYVEDRRNALIMEWKASSLTVEEMASLQAALKSAIQAVFQLEDNELAAESLPDTANPASILYYESAEGGAGVLRRLVEDTSAIRQVARKALEICHFDPDSLDDLGKAPRAKENCSSACYDCLMSYGNQRSHLLLDRHIIKDLLGALRDSEIEASSGSLPRSQKLEELLSQCGSSLEKEWLKLLEDKALALPTMAQHRIPECGTLPDFVYIHGPSKLAVYIDGPPHDYPQRQQRDAEQDMCLMDKGWIVQRFHHRDDWEELLRAFPSIYGELR